MPGLKLTTKQKEAMSEQFYLSGFAVHPHGQRSSQSAFDKEI
jgi:hypothetical protein